MGGVCKGARPCNGMSSAKGIRGAEIKTLVRTDTRSTVIQGSLNYFWASLQQDRALCVRLFPPREASAAKRLVVLRDQPSPWIAAWPPGDKDVAIKKYAANLALRVRSSFLLIGDNHVQTT
ncbi:hypothetical protein GCM10007863_41430 [Dyella mobilis]|nr:hypothetical protein GCM10007863_41430 [Dyella mobilis]